MGASLIKPILSNLAYSLKLLQIDVMQNASSSVFENGIWCGILLVAKYFVALTRAGNLNYALMSKLSETGQVTKLFHLRLKKYLSAVPN